MELNLWDKWANFGLHVTDRATAIEADSLIHVSSPT